MRNARPYLFMEKPLGKQVFDRYQTGRGGTTEASEVLADVRCIRKRVSSSAKWSNRSLADQSPGLTNRERSISSRDACACQIGRPRVAHEYRYYFVRRDLAFQHHLRCHLYRDRVYIPQQLQADYSFERSRSRPARQGRPIRRLHWRHCITVDLTTARIHPIYHGTVATLHHEDHSAKTSPSSSGFLKRRAALIRWLA